MCLILYLCHWRHCRALSFEGSFVLVCLGLFFFPARAWKRWGEVWLALGQKPGFLGWTGAFCVSQCLCLCDASGLPQKLGAAEETGAVLSWWKCLSVALCSEQVCHSLAYPRHSPVTAALCSLQIKEIWDLKAQCCVCCPYLILYDTEIYVKNLNSFDLQWESISLQTHWSVRGNKFFFSSCVTTAEHQTEVKLFMTTFWSTGKYFVYSVLLYLIES